MCSKDSEKWLTGQHSSHLRLNHDDNRRGRGKDPALQRLYGAVEEGIQVEGSRVEGNQEADTLVAGIQAEDSLAEGSLGVDILGGDSLAADSRNLVR